MADEPVIDEVVEQDAVTEDAPQVDDAAGDVSTDNVLADVSGDAVDTEPESMPDEPVEAVAEPESPVIPDLSTLDADLLRESRPDLVERFANAERQRTIAQMRKEAGNRENTRMVAEAQMRKLGVDPATVQDPSAWYLMAESNRSYEHDQLMRGIAKTVVDTYGLDGAVLQGFEQTIESLNGDDLTKYTNKLFSDAVEGRSTAKVSEIRLADIPEGSQLRKDLQAEITKVRQAERAAAQKDRPAKEPPPATPGVPLSDDAGGTDPVLTKLEAQGSQALSAAERERALGLLGLKAN